MANKFKKRRDKILNKYLKEKEAFLIIGEKNLGGKPFKINSNILYLTGIKEENNILLLFKGKGGKKKEILIIQNKNPDREKWEGIRLGKEKAKEISGIDKVEYLKNRDNVIAGVLNKMETVYINYKNESTLSKKNNKRKSFIRDIKYNFPHLDVKNSTEIMKKLRTVKDDSEVKLIKKAIEITKEALYYTWENIEPGMREYEVKAMINYQIKKRGAKIAFNTIVAGGPNGVILHYPDGDRKLKKNDLLLFDVGARWKGYSADISRTVPVSGKFSKSQKEIYEIVLKTNKQSIKNVEVGKTLKDIANEAKEILKKGLKSLDLIDKDEELKKYYYHSIGHHLGLDTHDLSFKSEQLKERAVITIEPGLYIKEKDVGIRIEDDVLVDENEVVNLSENIAKETDEIESIMNK
ncbi:MAG: M24 family metallopeptidase [Candidatus Mcinerneyibacterium aminivorans]|uniref:Xaa-Pro aminopeptidase n=1 Tax=Candidatus Mcinerneyibacterium aminivorans TaxID=2703815 RepID=A0A5D0MCZ2_9BACT|nr:MAG: M24 family metallopeptidase [Candidatus Mcinerneyibacterium aminivorans]